MSWIKGFIIFLIAVAVGFIIYTLYFHFGPYKRVSVENQQLKEEVAKLRPALEEIDVSKAQLAQKSRQVEDLETELEGMRTTISKMEGERRTVVVEAEQLRKALEESRSRISEMSQEIESLRGEYAQKTESLEGHLAQRDINIEALKDEAEHLQQTVASLEGKTQALSDETAELKRQLEESRSRVQGLSQQLAAREETLEGLEKTHQAMIEKLQKESQERTARVKDFEKESQEKTARVADLEREIKRLRGETSQKVEILQGHLAQRDRNIQGLENEAKQLRQTIATLEGNTKALSRDKNELERQLQDSRSQIQRLSQGMATGEGKLEELERTHQQLVKQLNAQIQEKEVEISTLNEKLNIRFLDKILFGPGNAAVTPDGREVLKSVAEELKKLSGTRIHVEGHSDDLPLSEEARAVYVDNLGLSMARAAAVARTFRTMGLDPALLSVAGYSMYRPIASNSTPEGREQNRRVEIILVPLR